MKTVSVGRGAVVQIGETIQVKVLSLQPGRAKLLISAPAELAILRKAAGASPPRKRPLRKKRNP